MGSKAETLELDCGNPNPGRTSCLAMRDGEGILTSLSFQFPQMQTLGGCSPPLPSPGGRQGEMIGSKRRGKGVTSCEHLLSVWHHAGCFVFYLVEYSAHSGGRDHPLPREKESC